MLLPNLMSLEQRSDLSYLLLVIILRVFIEWLWQFCLCRTYVVTQGENNWKRIVNWRTSSCDLFTCWWSVAILRILDCLCPLTLVSTASCFYKNNDFLRHRITFKTLIQCLSSCVKKINFFIRKFNTCYGSVSSSLFKLFCLQLYTLFIS